MMMPKFNILKQKFTYATELSFNYFKYIGQLQCFILIFSTLFASILSTAGYAALLPIIGFIFNNSENVAIIGSTPVFNNSAFSFLNNRSLANYLFAYCLLILIKQIVLAVHSYYIAYIDAKYMNHVRSRLLCVSTEDLIYYKNEGIDQYLFLLNIIPKLDSFFWAITQLIIRFIIITAIFIIIVFKFSKLLPWILLFISVWGVFLLPLLKWNRKESFEYINSQNKFNSFFHEYFYNIDILHLFNLKKYKDLLFEKIKIQNINSCTKNSTLKQISATAPEFLIVGLIILVFVLNKKLGITFSTLASFGYLGNKLLSLFSEVNMYVSSANEQFPYLDMLYKKNLLCPDQHKYPIEFSNITPSKQNTIEISNFGFKIGSKYIFEKLNMQFYQGDLILLTGPNGSGKTTFIKSIMNLLPYEGRLDFNTAQVKPFTVFNEYFSYVPQDPYLFEDTILNNILLGSGKQLSDLKSLLVQVGVELDDNFFEIMAQSGGKNLSGGQKQLVSILRGLMRNYNVLIVDEFTNHLSKDISEKFLIYISKIENKIIFLISHADYSFANKKLSFSRGSICYV